jgi:hypothetical protein
MFCDPDGVIDLGAEPISMFCDTDEGIDLTQPT